MNLKQILQTQNSAEILPKTAIEQNHCYNSFFYMETNNKCTECGAYHGHSPSCSLMSEEYAKSELIR